VAALASLTALSQLAVSELLGTRQAGWALAGAGLLAGLVSAYAVRVAFLGRKSDPRIEKVYGTVLLGPWLLEAGYWLLRGSARLVLRAPITPDALTLGSLVITLCAAPLAASGEFAVAALALLAGGALDALDGIVARARGIASDSGEVLDSFVDRYADAAPLVGLSLYYRSSAWLAAIPLAGLVGAMMVSYSRAKAEAMRVDLPSGLMRRHERIAYLVAALLVGPALGPFVDPWLGVEGSLTLGLLAFLALLTNLTAVRLCSETRAKLVALGRGPGGAH
jgi:CDP-diacylglycerol--glycerol-3-phosphate 3-phosphatidyltransferase